MQIFVLVFFYNEYFNEKKLTNIERQLSDTQALRNLKEDSRKQLQGAQENLQKYVNKNDKKFLENYFHSLRNLNKNIDSIKIYENRNLSLKQEFDSRRKEISELDHLENLIDSVYRESKKPLLKKTPLKIQKFQIKKEPEKLEIAIRHSTSSDSVLKKGLFPRLKDAIQGNVEVKRDTTYITTKYESSVDTSKIKSDLDSTIKAVNKHYVNEINKYKSHINVTQSKSANLYRVYDNLILVSNKLMEIYDKTITDFSHNLEEQYKEQSSRNNTIRKYSVLVMIILMLVVSVLIMYYTKQSFQYEKELKIANNKINQNLRFKNRILGMLSHEVRAPLKIINIFIQRIGKKTNDEDILDYLKSIKFTNDSLLIQANQILEYTKNQDQQIKLNPTDFNLKNEIDNVLNIFKPYIESGNNTFEIENEVNHELNVRADKTKIHQIFINILGNANKFTENGKITVNAKAVSVNPHIVKLQVSVADTGYGISEKDKRNIFKPYYQGMVSNEIENLGAGLGLNLCKEIIDLLKGKISVESSLGKGTIVFFEFNLNISK